MSLIKAMKSVFGGGRQDAGDDRLCVVDGERMTDGREAGPGDRFQVLQRLGKFAEREKVRMQVVFSGRPLREAEHGAEFMGMKVFYVEQGENYVEQFIGIAKDAMRRDSVLVITNDLELEKKIIEMGSATLRASTLRKAFESGEGGGEFRGGERGGEFRGGDRGPRRRGGRGGRGGPRRGPPGGGRPQNDEGDSGGGGPSNAGDASTSGGQTQVKNLIDLVE